MRKLIFVPLSVAQTFKMHPRNRAIDRKHLQKIKKAMKESFDVFPAITVNEKTLHIIDGQHRFEAYKQLIEEGYLNPESKLAVMYVDTPAESELDAIIGANINTRGWTPADYIHSYIKDGNQDYIRLDDWAKNHSLTANMVDPDKPKYRYAAVMMKGSTLRRELPHGDFTVSDEELKMADKVHNEAVKLIDLFGLPSSGQWVENMLTSWFKNRNLHKFSEWTGYIRNHKGGLRKLPKATVSDWDAIFAKAHSELDIKRMSA